MRFLRQSLTGLFLAAATLALLMYAGKMIGSAIQVRLSDTPVIEAPRERVFAVNVLTATAQTLTPVLTAFGEVQSRRTLEIRAATGGRIVELADAFQEGGDVKAGQSLIRIDPADAQSALDRITSDLRDAEAEVRDAARGLDLARDATKILHAGGREVNRMAGKQFRTAGANVGRNRPIRFRL